MEDPMRSSLRPASLALLVATASSAVVWSQAPRPPQSPYLAPDGNLVAVRAGRMFDAKAGTMLNNQIILVRGDRIADVGPSVQVPPEARVIDLGAATVLPGMIDAHVHNAGRGDSADMKAIVMVQSATRDLEAGFTTTVDMDSRGGFGTVDLRNAINEGVVKGPRMQVAGQSLNQRASAPYPNLGAAAYSAFTEGKNINGPWLARAAVRESKLHGVDWIKIYTTQDFVGEELDEFKPDGSLVASPSLTFEEVQAVVDEAHRMGLKVACHTYGGDGMRSCITAGVDLSMHVTELYKDDALVNALVQKKLPIMITIDDLAGLDAGDKRLLAKLGLTGDKAVTRLAMAELTFRKLLKAGVPLVFGSGAGGGDGTFPHGKQGDQFAWMVRWGMTPAQALQSVFIGAAGVLNYNWANRVGTLEKGKFADIIAVAGNPLTDVTEMERVRFVMKGGVVMRNELPPRATPSTAAR
jgi:imidazolonepropionase-like amidohydrolase